MADRENNNPEEEFDEDSLPEDFEDDVDDNPEEALDGEIEDDDLDLDDDLFDDDDLDDDEEIDEDSSSELNDKSTSVASNPASRFFLMVVFGLVAAFVLYKFIFTTPAPSTSTEDTDNPAPRVSIASPHFENIPENLVPDAPILDEDLPAPTPPSVPNIDFSLESSNIILPSGSDNDKDDKELHDIFSEDDLVVEKRQDERINFGDDEGEIDVPFNPERFRTGFFTYGGGQGGESIAQMDNSMAFDPLSEVPETGAPSSDASRIMDLRHTIAQGKIISTVLETAINSDLPGMLRAIISRDVYSESGKNILIPKGSRVIGTYQSSVARGQKRLVISWGRVILPNGVDIQLDSPGTDQFGRTGVTGEIDNKYWEILSSSALLSVITIGSAIIADSVSDNDSQVTETTTTEGSTSTTSDPSGLAVSALSETVGSGAKQFVENAFNLSPTITIDQGTRIKIYVNKDLKFPPQHDYSGITYIK